MGATPWRAICDESSGFLVESTGRRFNRRSIVAKSAFNLTTAQLCAHPCGKGLPAV
jgi:hypothetical protein